MKVILVGYPESQRIVPASSYLVHKYMPGFDIRFLNYEGEKMGWSKFCADYLRTLDDEYVIFALDDYLLCQPMQMERYSEAVDKFVENVVCVKLHRSTNQEHNEYPVTTQYTIWDRTFLISLLDQTTDPWNFEIKGSKILQASKMISVPADIPALEYFTSSCLSRRWEGIRWNGVNEEDRLHIAQNFNL